MSIIIPESALPQELTVNEAVDAAYPTQMEQVAADLKRGLPVLVECDKDLVPFAYINLRNRLRQDGIRCQLLDGRPRPEDEGMMNPGFVGIMLAQLRDAVRGTSNLDRRVVVLPHIDLLTTSQGGLTAEAREVIPLLYENPDLVWLGFKDPSFTIPKVIENLFPRRYQFLGIARDRLARLVTQKESRKFGRQFNPWGLYKYVSGMNAARLRKLLTTLDTEDFPEDPRRAYQHIRQATASGHMEIPNIDLDKQVGGYKKVKERLRKDILDVLTIKDSKTDETEIRKLEELIPKGMIFWGPPGTGKTLFAKAMATAIGAAITIVSGPEMKSKWVGESLPYEEPVFVILNGKAQRIPIGELVEHHQHDDVRAWTVGDDGAALLAPVTGFLKHRGPDYIDTLVTETGRQVRVTGGHSLFVRDEHNQLTEVFAEQVEPGKTRVAVPLRLQAPESLQEINLLERLGNREDVRVQGYDGWLNNAVEQVGETRAGAACGVAVRKLRWTCQRPPLTLAGLRRLAEEAGTELDPAGLTLYCWHRGKHLPAVLPLTPEFGEFLGRWVADGCFHRTGVRISVHVDELEQVEGLCQRLFGHVTRYTKGEHARGADLVINSTLLRYVLMDALGMCDGSGFKRVPADIFLAPLPVVAGFLRGYFSGDGTFNGKYIEATTTSRELAADVMTLLQYFGIAARCREKAERKGARAYRVRFIWSEFLRKFADQIGFADARRHDALRSYLDGMTFKRDLQTPARHITNDVLWDLVVEKRREPYAREHVYDISVPDTERFIAGFGNVLVHNSEENIRQIFHQARQSAPSIIVFDELDSFASARGTYTGSGVEHSMVNQLLTEMDGFRKEELVFVVGTTNFVESLDPALLRPGRFEFQLQIPYPNSEDRREILKIYNKSMKLEMTDETLDFTVKRTAGYVEGSIGGTLYSGDHLNALCRSIARIRLREDKTGPTTPKDVERALTEWTDRPKLTPKEEIVVATHEAGHAVTSMFLEYAEPIDRISIQGDAGALGYVKHQDPAHKHVITQKKLLDLICTLMGGREAEKLLLDDLSIGSVGDIEHATEIARELVEMCGMGGPDVGQSRTPTKRYPGGSSREFSQEQLSSIDRAVRKMLDEGAERSAKILRENRAILESLRDLLIQKKVLDSKALADVYKSAGREFPKETNTTPPTTAEGT